MENKSVLIGTVEETFFDNAKEERPSFKLRNTKDNKIYDVILDWSLQTHKRYIKSGDRYLVAGEMDIEKSTLIAQDIEMRYIVDSCIL